MIIPFGFHTVVRQRGVVATDEGNTEYVDWTTPATLTITGASMQPYTTTESDSSARDVIVDEWKLYAPGAPDIKTNDRVTYAGKTFEVDGEPMVWPSPFDGTAHHTEVRLRILHG